MDLRVIGPDTAKDAEANKTNKAFAESYDELLTTHKRMTGFMVVVFDEKGNPYWHVYMGEHFPLPSPMLPEVLKQCALAAVYSQ